MPSTLSWRCTPIHSKSRQNAPKSASTGKLARARALPVANRPVDLPFLVPLDVRIAQQRHEVVGDRAVAPRPGNRARPGFGVADHQVARMVVAMDEHPRLREVVGERSRRTPAASDARCAGVSVAPRCLRDVPVGEERELARAAAPRRRAAARRRASRAASGSARRSHRCRAPAPTARRARRGRSSCRDRSAAGTRASRSCASTPAHARRRPRSSRATCTNGRQSSVRRRRVHAISASRRRASATGSRASCGNSGGSSHRRRRARSRMREAARFRAAKQRFRRRVRRL